MLEHIPFTREAFLRQPCRNDGRHGAAFILMGSLLLFGFPVQSTAASRRSSRSPWRFSLRLTGDSRYDDNILSLSSREKQLLKDPVTGRSDRFRIVSEDDVIFVPQVTAALGRHPRKGRNTDLTLTLRAYDYQRNNVRDYQQYNLSIRQELNRSEQHGTVLSAGWSRVPHYYLRQLVDDEQSLLQGMTVRSSADYAMNSAYVRITQKVIDHVLTVSSSFARERRNYNAPFDGRDAGSNVTVLAASIYPLARVSFRIRPYYEHEQRGSRGDLSGTTVVDDDIGFDGDLAGIDVRLRWGPDRDHRRTLRAWYKDENRDFTTSTVTDAGHFGRSDDIQQFGAEYQRDLNETLSLRFRYRHRTNDVSLPGTAGMKTTSFKKNVFAAGLVFHFDRRLRSSSRGRRTAKRPPRS